MVLKASKRSGALLRNFRHLKASTLAHLFKLLVRPILEFNCQIWNPSKTYSIKLIESVQRHFTKKLRGFKDQSYTQRCDALGLPTLKKRRGDLYLVLTFSLLNGLVDLDWKKFFQKSSDKVRTSTRTGNSLALVPNLVKREWEKSVFENRVVEPWNALGEQTVCAPSVCKFKEAIYSGK